MGCKGGFLCTWSSTRSSKLLARKAAANFSRPFGAASPRSREVSLPDPRCERSKGRGGPSHCPRAPWATRACTKALSTSTTTAAMAWGRHKDSETGKGLKAKGEFTERKSERMQHECCIRRIIAINRSD